MAFVALIGTNHANQFPGNPHGRADLFSEFLASQARDLAAHLLAEEMSTEALHRAKVEESSVQRVARALELDHLFCDPDTRERSILGIPDYEQLKHRRGLKHVLGDNVSLLEQDERTYWPLREAEWLRRLQESESERIVLVVGPNHVQSFATALCNNSYEITIITDRWEG